MATPARPTGGAPKGKGLVCAVCREVYRSPRILPCFHTFCLTCLEGVSGANGGQFFPCPSCRRPTAVPPAGATVFQVNFYITEEELEAARNEPISTMCSEPAHQTSPLEFFCVPCDSAICLRCKLTKHERHEKTLDLAEVAARCRRQLEQDRGRLDQVIDVLTNKSAEAREHLSAARQKGIEIKAVIQANTDALLARLNQRRDVTLEQVDRSISSIEQQLSRDARDIHKELDSLLLLRQRIHHGVRSSASHAELVTVEKEMRQGQGSEARLKQVVSSCSPATTLRPGLRHDGSACSDDDIDRYLSVPVVLTLPFQAALEEVVPIYQCDQEDGACHQVHSVCRATFNMIFISFGGTPPDYAGSKVICINDDGKAINICCQLPPETYQSSEPSSLNLQMSLEMRHRYRSSVEGGRYFRHARGGCLVETERENDTTQRVVEITISSVSPLHRECTTLFEVHCGRAVAFNVTEDGQLFAFVEKKNTEHGDRTESTVLLFHRDQWEPFAAYRPADVPGFHPTDVCFWREDEQGQKLLVADEQNDAVHVVSLENNQCRFERYLAAGNGLLVSPTALDVDQRNRVWIGCGNGRILRCDPPADDQGLEFNADIANLLVDSSEDDLDMTALVSM